MIVFVNYLECFVYRGKRSLCYKVWDLVLGCLGIVRFVGSKGGVGLMIILLSMIFVYKFCRYCYIVRFEVGIYL